MSVADTSESAESDQCRPRKDQRSEPRHIVPVRHVAVEPLDQILEEPMDQILEEQHADDDTLGCESFDVSLSTFLSASDSPEKATASTTAKEPDEAESVKALKAQLERAQSMLQEQSLDRLALREELIKTKTELTMVKAEKTATVPDATEHARELASQLKESKTAHRMALRSLMRSFDDQYISIERDLGGTYFRLLTNHWAGIQKWLNEIEHFEPQHMAIASLVDHMDILPRPIPQLVDDDTDSIWDSDAEEACYQRGLPVWMTSEENQASVTANVESEFDPDIPLRLSKDVPDEIQMEPLDAECDPDILLRPSKDVPDEIQMEHMDAFNESDIEEFRDDHNLQSSLDDHPLLVSSDSDEPFVNESPVLSVFSEDILRASDIKGKRVSVLDDPQPKDMMDSSPPPILNSKLPSTLQDFFAGSVDSISLKKAKNILLRGSAQADTNTTRETASGVASSKSDGLASSWLQPFKSLVSNSIDSVGEALRSPSIDILSKADLRVTNKRMTKRASMLTDWDVPVEALISDNEEEEEEEGSGLLSDGPVHVVRRALLPEEDSRAINHIEAERLQRGKSKTKGEDGVLDFGGALESVLLKVDAWSENLWFGGGDVDHDSHGSDKRQSLPSQKHRKRE